MCDPQVLLAFVVACAALILTPGPSQALVLSRTLEGSRAAGMFTAVGINAASGSGVWDDALDIISYGAHV